MLYILRGSIKKAHPYQLDKTLTVEGAGAEAKATGDAIAEAKRLITEHAKDTSNSHNVTKSQVGLGNVDNTADIDKPVSTLQGKAIADAKKAGTNAQSAADEAKTAAKNAAENALPKAGGTMSGNIVMGGNKVTGLADPTEDGDAANKKYVADYAETRHLIRNATLSADWEGESAPYSQTVTVEGILVGDNAHVMPVYSDDMETALLEKEAWAMVNKADTSNGSIIFTCFEDKPNTAINVQIEVNR